MINNMGFIGELLFVSLLRTTVEVRQAANNFNLVPPRKKMYRQCLV